MVNSASVESPVNNRETTTRPFLQMACEDPFRIFFPLGLIAGISGVTLWPLYFAGIHHFYPGIMHARFMMEGFMAAFVLGFLGTAAPRLTGTPRFSPRELSCALALYAATFASHLSEQYWLGDLFFLSLLLVYAVFLGRRFFKAKNLPPPGFVLVGFGFLCAIAGTACLLAGEVGLGSSRWTFFGGTLLNELWVLFLILGVGSFLLPRILKISPQSFGLNAPPNWRKRALRAGAAGMAILLLCLLDVYADLPRLTALARFLVAAGYVISQIGLHRSQAPKVTITRCLYLAMLLALLGLLFPAAWPLQRVAGLHVVFIGGFGLMTLTVATRVVLGHSGFDSMFFKKLPFLGATALLFISGMVLRSGADFVLPWRGGAISLGAILWATGAVIWGWNVLPKVRFADSE